MNNKNLKKIAIISSPNAGLGHYAAHLIGPLSKYYDTKFLTYPQTDLLGTVTNQFTDSFMKRYIKWPRFDVIDSEPQSIVKIGEYLRSRNIQLVNIHIGTTLKQKINYFMSFVTYCKKRNGTKFVFSLHDVLPWNHDIRMISLLKVFYSLTDHFIIGNNKEYLKLKRYFSFPDEKISIIKHGIYDLFDNDLYNSKVARYLLNIPQDKTVLLFFGFLKEFKGFEYLIKAVHILIKKNPNIIVYVASGLKYAPKELVQKCLTLIHKLQLDEYFLLNLNYLDANDIEAVFKASNISILPYTNASQSGVLMMSIGFKKPVVITDVFAEKEWINKFAGLIAKKRNPEDLAKKIEILIKSPEIALEYGMNGFTYGKKHLNWEAIAKKYSDVFTEVLSK